MEKITISPNLWETDFFKRNIAQLSFSEETGTPSVSLAHFDLVQTKLGSHQLEQIAQVQQLGFVLVEGEIDFCLDLTAEQCPEVSLVQATEQDIPSLQTLFGNAFPNSRFRPPFYSTSDNQRFYAEWIKKAVLGTFDHLCLLARSEQGEIQGGISVRSNGTQARIGLLAVAPQFQGQGVAKKLLQQAICYAKQQGATELWIATQISNLAAINLYTQLGAKTKATNYWFYKENRS